MWNVNMRRGTIWSTKSINQYEYNYIGMTAGSAWVLILNAFTDENGYKKIIYFRISNTKPEIALSVPIQIKNDTKYVLIDNILTGQQEALESFVYDLSLVQISEILKLSNAYYNLSTKIKKTKPEIEKEEFDNNCQRRIHKFGIDIYVTENENVTISETNKLMLSQSARNDIIYNSKTDYDIRLLCDKYMIYPAAAIKNIRNRLVYQHKQKEG